MKILFLFARILGFCIFQLSVAFSQNQILFWPNGESTTTFGPNSTVIIDIGKLDFINDCHTGKNDFVFPWTDIYVIPSAPVLPIGTPLIDVTGVTGQTPNGWPNTIEGSSDGTFVNEILGFTKPGGVIGPGTYSIVYDECQNGIFDAEDGYFPDAFQVVISLDVPSIDPDIITLKEEAGVLGVYWFATYFYTKYVFALAELHEVQGFINHYHSIESRIGAYLYLIEKITGQALHVHPKHIALEHLYNNALHYSAIFLDPPDSNFQQITYLNLREVIIPNTEDELIKSYADLETALNVEEVILLSLLKSIERYKGAEIANDAEWALIHAKEVKKYAKLLREYLSDMNAVLSTLDSTLLNDDRPLDSLAKGLEDFRIRVQTSGFLPEELETAACLGLTSSRLTAFRDSLIATGSIPLQQG
jgi:hypothetical protein